MSTRLRFLPDPTALEDSFVAGILRRETVGGAIALIAAACAVVWANSPIAEAYTDLRHLTLGPLDVEHWAAEGALSLFFFVVGLELKREFVVGSLSRLRDAVVPIVAAACGVAVPALIYLAVNATVGGDLRGWAIPSATDIAFALAVLAVVGSALPPQLRAFLLTLAVVDDLIVIVIIAMFFTSRLNPLDLTAAAATLGVYALAQRLRVTSWLVFVPLAAAAWWFTHESGIHATIAGVALGLLTRVRHDENERDSPAERLEHRLVPLSAGVAVPFFALMSAGVAIGGAGPLLDDPIVIGVVLGLVVGKPLGVFGGSWLLTRLTRAEIDDDVAWPDVFGVSVLAGIGFTVSLLVSDLSFPGAERDAAKTAVLAGSMLSAVAGAAVLVRRSRRHRRPAMLCRVGTGISRRQQRKHMEPVKADDPTIGKLVSDASRDISTLISTEIRLLKSELKLNVKLGGLGAALLAAAVFLLLISVILLSMTAAYFINWNGDGLALHWAFLIVSGFYLLLAGLLAFVGVRKVKQVKGPERAIQQAQETRIALTKRH